MENPSTSAPEPTRTIKLSEVANRYLLALQKLYDTFAFNLGGTRILNEEQYDQFAHSAGVMPVKDQRMGFDAARIEANNWLLGHTLTDALSLTVMAMADCRSICALTLAGKQGDSSPESRLRVMTTDREAFNRLSLLDKFSELENSYGLKPAYKEAVLSLGRVREILKLRGGRVAQEDLEGKDELQISYRKVELRSQPSGSEGTVSVTPQVRDIQKTFSDGDSLDFDKADQLAFLSTLAFFLGSLLEEVQTFAQRQGVA